MPKVRYVQQTGIEEYITTPPAFASKMMGLPIFTKGPFCLHISMVASVLNSLIDLAML